MAWWAWLLIAVGVIGIGYLKLKVWNRIVAKRRDREQQEQEEE